MVTGSLMELTHVNVILFIASGTLVVCLLFLFAKRQIVRFTLRSARRPHVGIGTDAPKILKTEILTMVGRTADIKYEPKLIHDRCEMTPDSLKNIEITCNYRHRMLALDALSAIDLTLKKEQSGYIPRHPSTSVRQYLITLQHKGILLSASTELIHSFADAYHHARHRPEKFGPEEYKNYIELLQALLSCIKMPPKVEIDHAAQHSKLETEVVLTNANSPTKTKTQTTKSPSNEHPAFDVRSPRFRGSRPTSLEKIGLIELSKESSSSPRTSDEQLDSVTDNIHSFEILEPGKKL